MSKIQIGDYVIMNEADKPCTRLIAEVIELSNDQNFVRGRYICKNTNMREPYGKLSDVTLVSSFGVEMFFNEEMVGTEQVRPSVAKYQNGAPREWQPSGENPEQKLFNVKNRKKR